MYIVLTFLAVWLACLPRPWPPGPLTESFKVLTFKLAVFFEESSC
jgi:hypothetical protein